MNSIKVEDIFFDLGLFKVFIYKIFSKIDLNIVEDKILGNIAIDLKRVINSQLDYKDFLQKYEQELFYYNNIINYNYKKNQNIYYSFCLLSTFFNLFNDKLEDCVDEFGLNDSIYWFLYYYYKLNICEFEKNKIILDKFISNVLLENIDLIYKYKIENKLKFSNLENILLVVDNEMKTNMFFNIDILK